MESSQAAISLPQNSKAALPNGTTAVMVVMRYYVIDLHFLILFCTRRLLAGLIRFDWRIGSLETPNLFRELLKLLKAQSRSTGLKSSNTLWIRRLPTNKAREIRQ